ncbi:hypothetical protein BBJ28_00018961 [Nothophytophthora sp. Chile5]|nr:hypothetical protein BBJ28_00018961 [Nothophytophthora sp. Chile5]
MASAQALNLHFRADEDDDWALRSFDAGSEEQQAEGGTCSYYPQDQNGCRRPRSCFDCLNADLAGEPEGCMVNEGGRCVSVLGHYDAASDFRTASSSNSQQNGDIDDEEVGEGTSSSSSSSSSGAMSSTIEAFKRPGPFQLQFPAVNLTYCNADDVLWSTEQLSTLGFGYGTGGCVVVAVCEAPDWAQALGGSDCSIDLDDMTPTPWQGPNFTTPYQSNVDTDSDSNSAKVNVVFWSAATVILVTLLAALAMAIAIRHRHRRRNDETQWRNQRNHQNGETTVTESYSVTPKHKSDRQQLNLFGWETMRAELIENERLELQALPQSDKDSIDVFLPHVSPSAHYLQLVRVQPSAPAMSPVAVASSAPRLTDL